MDIKNVFRHIIPMGGPKAPDAANKTRSKTDADNDREGNGQAGQEGQPGERRALTPEEIEEAVKYLESLSGIKENGLSVRTKTDDGITVVYVEDRVGKIVRRIPESELRQLVGRKVQKSGNLLNKAM